MDAKDIPKALEPFGQIDSSLTRQHCGTDLGLPLVKSMIELHGGARSIESRKAAGTTVMLIFPPARVKRSKDAGRAAPGQAPLPDRHRPVSRDRTIPMMKTSRREPSGQERDHKRDGRQQDRRKKLERS